MRRILWTGIAVAALTAVLGSPAAAKPGHPEGAVKLTPTLATPPAGISGGQKWDAAITFPADQAQWIDDELRLYVRVRHTTSGIVKVFSAGMTGRGSYLVPIVFPSAGSWAVEVVTSGETWPMSPVSVARSAPVSAPGFPTIPVGIAVAAAIAVLAVALGPRVRRARAVPALS